MKINEQKFSCSRFALTICSPTWQLLPLPLEWVREHEELGYRSSLALITHPGITLRNANRSRSNPWRFSFECQNVLVRARGGPLLNTWRSSFKHMKVLVQTCFTQWADESTFSFEYVSQTEGMCLDCHSNASWKVFHCLIECHLPGSNSWIGNARAGSLFVKYSFSRALMLTKNIKRKTKSVKLHFS